MIVLWTPTTYVISCSPKILAEIRIYLAGNLALKSFILIVIDGLRIFLHILVGMGFFQLYINVTERASEVKSGLVSLLIDLQSLVLNDFLIKLSLTMIESV